MRYDANNANKISFERIGDFRDTDYAIQYLLHNLIDYLQGKITKRNDTDVYLFACLKLAAENPMEFRHRAYSFHDVRFCNWHKNKRGKLIDVVAYFSGRRWTERGKK